jgi:hypothetical protein
MADATDLSETIAEEAVSPASSSSDGQASAGRSISELIEADQYLAAKAAAAQRRRGIVFTQLIPPGTLPDCGAPGPFGGGVCG